MAIYSDKRTGRLFIQFEYKKQLYKEHLPPGMTKTEGAEVEVKMRHDAFLEARGMAPKKQDIDTLFELFVDNTFLPSILSRQGPEAHKRAEDICLAALLFLKGKGLRSIRPDDIKKVRDYRSKLKTQHGKERRPATVSREMAIISKIFSEAVENGACDYNPCSRVKMPKFDNLVDRVLEIGDDDRFFANFDRDQGSEARDICKLVLNTGLSQKDIFGLTAFNVNLQTRTLTITRSKTTRHVIIPLNDTAFEICRSRLKGGFLFTSSKTGKKRTSVRTAMAGACKRANIVRKKLGLPAMHILTIRDLRRTFGTRLHESGEDAMTIAQLLGHAGLRMIPRYVRSVKKGRLAVENLERFSTNSTQNLQVASGQNDK